jgi:hypothetical protein
MWNRTALLVAALAFALPALADEPSNLPENARPVASKTTAPKSPKNLKGPKVGTYQTEKINATFSDPTIRAGNAGIGSGSWSKAGSGSSHGIKHKHKPANNGNTGKVGGPIVSGFNIKKNASPTK